MKTKLMMLFALLLMLTVPASAENRFQRAARGAAGYYGGGVYVGPYGGAYGRDPRWVRGGYGRVIGGIGGVIVSAPPVVVPIGGGGAPKPCQKEKIKGADGKSRDVLVCPDANGDYRVVADGNDK